MQTHLCANMAEQRRAQRDQAQAMVHDGHSKLTVCEAPVAAKHRNQVRWTQTDQQGLEVCMKVQDHLVLSALQCAVMVKVNRASQLWKEHCFSSLGSTLTATLL